MIIITHPSNIKKIESLCSDDSGLIHEMHMFHTGYKVIASDFMPPTRPSGKWSINGIGSYNPDDFEHKTPFVTYGPEYMPYLKWAGIAKEREEMNVMVMNEDKIGAFYGM